MKVINRTQLRSRLSNSLINDTVKSEIAIMRSLNHPNIVKLYEALEAENSKKIYMVMEYCSKGCMLSRDYWKAQEQSKNNFLAEDRVEGLDEKRLSFYQAKLYFVQIVRGLNYRKLKIIIVHNVRNIVHHDIKPDNILIDTEDVAKITDFGISVTLGETESDEIYNSEWGTKMYLPPECWKSSPKANVGSRMFGKAIDVWALGCTFYQMIYNEFPFKQGTKLSDLQKSITTDE